MAKFTYLRFWRADQKSEPEAMFMSPVRADVEKWRKNKKPTEPFSDSIGKQDFEGIFVETNRLLNGYKQSSRLLNNISKIMGQSVASQVMRYGKNYGETLRETNNYLTLRVSESRIPDIERFIKQGNEYDMSGNYISSIFIIGLVSIYDGFLNNLIQAIFEHDPNRSLQIEKQFTIRELFTHGNLESFRRAAVGEFAEDILRKSHLEQFKKLEKILGVETLTKYSGFLKFIEVCERRNLFTHTGGVVTSTYIRKMREAGAKKIQFSEGDKAQADNEYISEAIDAVQETVVKLTIVCWYKLSDDGKERESIENHANNIAFELISEGRYILAKNILDFMLTGQPNKVTEGMRKMMIINLANAMKLAKDDGWKDVLAKEDWSAASNIYKFGKFAVEEDIPNMKKHLKGLVRDGEISKFSLMTWPLFENITDRSDFREMYKEAFGEDFIHLDMRARRNRKSKG